MRQLTLATVNFDKHSRQTRRAKFPAQMEQVVLWRELCALTEPFYPRPAMATARAAGSPVGLHLDCGGEC